MKRMETLHMIQHIYVSLSYLLRFQSVPVH
uniref:Uncharacterized protein n=1 Tax=Picea glauca TaxID=3330 RepID=A0A101LU11_PICGL|nr:hypothetical protein ABT39_MTgene3443 [Picea glauca]